MSATRRLGEERGQDTIEWVGVLVIVAVIILGALTLVPGMVKTSSRGVICTVDRIFGSNCNPPVYITGTETKTVGWNGRVFVVDGSHQYTVTMTHYSDGHVTISLQNQANVGASVRVGVEAELGSLGLSAQAQAGAAVYGEGSTTWSFKNAAAAQSIYSKLTQGSSTGVFLHDATSDIPGAGTVLNLFGEHGAPSSSSVSSKYVTSKGEGGGISANASASAGADIPGVVSANLSASIAASGGFVKITAGAQKGDWQAVGNLNATASGDLSSDLLGAGASGTGDVSGSLVVTTSPSGKLLSLSVTATGQGTWSVEAPSGPRAPSSVEVPGSESSSSKGSGESSKGSSGSGSGEGSSGGGSGEGESGEGSDEPLLKLDHDSSDEHGEGSSFTGTLNLADDPSASAAVSSVLHGNLADIPKVIDDMNSQGTEQVQTYKVSTSTDNYGGEVNAGVGGGGELQSNSASTSDNPPDQRVDGGPWQKQ